MADFSRTPDYSVVNPPRNWYQIAVAGVRPVLVEESPVDVVRRFQAMHGLTADGVIGDRTLAELLRVVEAARASIRRDGSSGWVPNDGGSPLVRQADIWVDSIRDDRARRRVSEASWKALIWASREDLNRVPAALFENVVVLSAQPGEKKSADPILFPPYGRAIPAVPGVVVPTATAPVPPAPAVQETPAEAGLMQAGASTALTVRRTASTSRLESSEARSSWTKYLPVIAVSAVSLAGLGWLLWTARREEQSAPQRKFDYNKQEYV